MNGLGNEIAVLDARERPLTLNASAVEALATPEKGIGFDQLMVLLPPRNPLADVYTEIWNADGSRVAACGNGSRCVAWYVMREMNRENLVIETEAGLLGAVSVGPNMISVDMGAPIFEWELIPMSERMDTMRIELQVGPIDDPVLHGPGVVSMGNPHCVFFVQDAELAPVEAVGPMIESHPLFPERTNVGFAEIVARDHIRLRVWERGAGLTKACGTGACAALVAAVRRRLCDRSAKVQVDGGMLQIEWRESDNHVIMTGAVALESEGNLSGN
jgi:diaminopimelate epimerase